MLGRDHHNVGQGRVCVGDGNVQMSVLFMCIYAAGDAQADVQWEFGFHVIFPTNPSSPKNLSKSQHLSKLNCNRIFTFLHFISCFYFGISDGILLETTIKSIMTHDIHIQATTVRLSNATSVI